MASNRPYGGAASPTGSITPVATPSALTPSAFSPAPLASASLSPVATTSKPGPGRKRKLEGGVGRGRGKRAKAAAAQAAQMGTPVETGAPTPKPAGGEGPSGQGRVADAEEEEDDDEDEEDGRGGAGFADDDYTVRKREDQANKEKLRILLEHFDPQQLERYTEYRNSGLSKTNIRRLANAVLQQSVSEKIVIATRGFAKVFVGHIIENALEIQKRRGGTGPLTTYDVKQAYRAHLLERDRGGSDRRKMFVR